MFLYWTFPVYNVITCEGLDMPTITCSHNTKIHVLYASYGRTQPSSKICPYETVHDDDTGCYSNEENLAAVCEGKQSCSIVPGELSLGDPCVNTYKYAEVRYICMPTGNLLRLVQIPYS